MLCLHRAFRARHQRILLVSATEDSSKLVLSEIAHLVSASPLLRGAVVDESKSQITLSNGSTITSVPASVRQIRGREAHLAVVDEAAYVDESIWTAVKYTVMATEDSQIVLTSTPYGRKDGWFAVHWRAGMESPGSPRQPGFASFHWPSTVSPMVDTDWLEQQRATTTDREYRTEVLAEWVDDAGSYFTAEELEHSVADYDLIDPAAAEGQMCVGGVDWGLGDANTLVLVGVLRDGNLNLSRHPTEPVFFIPHLEEHFGMRYEDFIERAVAVANERMGGFYVRYLASETNGVGAAPTEILQRRIHEAGTSTWVYPVHTDARRKESGYGALKYLLQAGRLVLPRHPTLLRQLSSLEFEISAAGNTRIAVPERLGHDDLADALMGALASVNPSVGQRPEWGWGSPNPGGGDIVRTRAGTSLPRAPRCEGFLRAFTGVRGIEQGDGW